MQMLLNQGDDMSFFYTREELLLLGFNEVGNSVMVSKDARFFNIAGSIGDRVRIDAFAVITGQIELETDVHVSPFCFIGGTGGLVRMKKRSGISTHVSIFTKSDDYTSKTGKRDGDIKISGDVILGERSILGMGCAVMPGVNIGDDASIGAGCIISRKIENGEVIINKGNGLVTLFQR